MSLQLMKERIKQSGNSLREEMTHGGQTLLREELENDPSYSSTIYYVIYGDNIQDGELGRLRIYGRKYSSLNGNYQKFITTIDNPVKIGDTFHDTKDDTYWLVQQSFNVNDIHYEGKMIQCNYCLKWQLSNGRIVKRWANIVSASKYDVGESGNSTIVLSSNNFTVLIPYCLEGKELEGKRVFIDRYDPPEKVFKITRGDDVLYDSGNTGSLLSFIADKTELNHVTDRQDLGICDYHFYSTPSEPTPPSGMDDITGLNIYISGNTNLRKGFPRTYTAVFTDENGNEFGWDNINFSWDIASNFDIDLIEQTITKNKITISVDDDSLIGESFLLCVKINDDIVARVSVDITESF